MGNTNVTDAKNSVNLNLSALDGLISAASRDLKLALKKMVGTHGVAATKAALTEIVSESTTP